MTDKDHLRLMEDSVLRSAGMIRELESEVKELRDECKAHRKLTSAIRLLLSRGFVGHAGWCQRKVAGACTCDWHMAETALREIDGRA
jgi:hypothetical protein